MDVLAGLRRQSSAHVMHAMRGICSYAAAMAPYLGRMGVNINAVAPGFIETEMTKKMPFVVRVPNGLSLDCPIACSGQGGQKHLQ